MADMSDFIKNFAQMMSSNSSENNKTQNLEDDKVSQKDSSSQVDFNEFFKNFSKNISSSNNPQDENKKTESSSNFEIPNIDISTMMKISQILSAMQSNQNSNSANLLLSLKPYLNPTRQKKVDEYIQLLNIEKVINVMNNLGGDSKNDS